MNKYECVKCGTVLDSEPEVLDHHRGSIITQEVYDQGKTGTKSVGEHNCYLFWVYEVMGDDRKCAGRLEYGHGSLRYRHNFRSDGTEMIEYSNVKGLPDERRFVSGV